MAITLDELLGMNTRTQDNKRVDSFPSYDDFSSRGRQQQESVQPTRPTYNFESRPASTPRSDEYMRNYERTRNYEVPRANEYQNREYDVYGVVERRRAVEPPQQSEDRAYGYSNYQSYANPSYQTAERRSSLYEFTMKDNDRLSDAELDAKLESRSYAPAARPMSAPRPVSARVEESVQERHSVFTPVKSEYKSESAKKARLNTKGKILLAVYLAVIVLVAVLIIVNAGDLNKGTATTPSSSVGAREFSDSNIQSNYAIDFEYDTQYEIR